MNARETVLGCRTWAGLEHRHTGMPTRSGWSWRAGRRARVALAAGLVALTALASIGCAPSQTRPSGASCVDALGVTRLDGCYAYRTCGDPLAGSTELRVELCTCSDGALSECGACLDVDGRETQRPGRAQPAYCDGRDADAGPSSGPEVREGPDGPQYTEAPEPRDPCVEPRTDAEREQCLFAADWGARTARDATDRIVVAGPARIDWIACVDGTLYGTAGAVSAIGVAALWGGAIIEPTPGGEAAAAAISAPVAGFLGGSVALKVSGGWDRCVRPLARVAWTAAQNGYGWAARGIRSLILAAVGASVCGPCPAARAPQCRQDCSPPSAAHAPCPGDHLHRYVYVMRQNPVTCECFERPQQTVTCTDHACDPARRATGRAPHNLGTYTCR